MLSQIVLLHIQTAAIVAAVVIAFYAILSNKNIAKKDKTDKLLLNDLEDPFLKDGLSVLREISINTTDDNIATYAHIKINDKDHNKYKNSIKIINLLNFYENISVSINKKVYDFDMIKRSQKTQTIEMYEKLEPYIKEVRKVDKNDNLFIEFEHFVNKLKK